MPNRYTERKSGTAGMQVLPTAVPERYDSADQKRKFKDHGGTVRAYVTEDQSQTLSNKTLASPILAGLARATENPLFDDRAAQSITTDGNVTYSAAQVLAGVIARSGITVNRTDAFPAAADLVAAISGARAGDSFLVLVSNEDDAQTITVNGASAGVTYRGTAAIAAGEAALFLLVLTNVAAGTEAYTAYQVS